MLRNSSDVTVDLVDKGTNILELAEFPEFIVKNAPLRVGVALYSSLLTRSTFATT